MSLSENFSYHADILRDVSVVPIIPNHTYSPTATHSYTHMYIFKMPVVCKSSDAAQ